MRANRTLDRYIVLIAILGSLLIGLFRGGGTQTIRSLASRDAVASSFPTPPPLPTRQATATRTPVPTRVAQEVAATDPGDRVPAVTPQTTLILPTPTLPPTSTPVAPLNGSPAPLPDDETGAAVPSESLIIRTLTRLNLRSGPALDAPWIATVDIGTELVAQARGEVAPWLLVELPNGEGTGWIYADGEFVEFGADLDALPIASADGAATP